MGIQNTWTRRQFVLAGFFGATGLSTTQRLRGQDLETYQSLGLHNRFRWESEINSHSQDEFGQFLNPPSDSQYSPCAEAYPAADVPRGEVRKIEKWARSRIFGQTERDIWVYQPAQLSNSLQPPDLMVFQDGGGYVDPEGPVRAPAVLDSLIHTGDLRPTVGVFINPGQRTVPRASDDVNFGQQRSVEYDTLTDAYVRFLLDEALPFVEDEIGRPFSSAPSRRLICGISSGGICAFTAAWFRPNSFRRVLSHCGSFTNIRGGHNYPYLVRTTIRKPIRVFLTSGKMDLDIPLGSWPLANKQMASALEYAGYDSRFAFGEGGHNLRHGGAHFADSLRWLTR